MAYDTYFTVEYLSATPTAGGYTEVVPVAANCNAITFRAQFVPQAAPNLMQIDDVGISGILNSGPEINGIKLVPFSVQNVTDTGNGNMTFGNEHQLQSHPAELTFDAGHPDAIDRTVYQVKLRQDVDRPVVGVWVIRRFLNLRK